MPKPMKAFTLRGVDGNYLTLSETEERDAIVVYIREIGPVARPEARVLLNAEQFEALCSMNSRYDGLKVEEEVTA